MSRETLDIVQWVLALVAFFCACMAVYSARQAIKFAEEAERSAECARQVIDSALLTSAPTFKASSRFSRPADLWKVL